MTTTERQGPQSRLTFEEADRLAENRKARAPQTIYDQLEAAVLPGLEHYHADLTEHDRRWIEEHPGAPFLHWSRKHGTDLIGLFPIEELPKAGERIPYLFGFADREHIVKSVVSVAEYESRKTLTDCFAVHHFDGRRLHRIDGAKALEIARQYQRSMFDQFDK